MFPTRLLQLTFFVASWSTVYSARVKWSLSRLHAAGRHGADRSNSVSTETANHDQPHKLGTALPAVDGLAEANVVQDSNLAGIPQGKDRSVWHRQKNLSQAHGQPLWLALYRGRSRRQKNLSQADGVPRKIENSHTKDVHEAKAGIMQNGLSKKSIEHDRFQNPAHVQDVRETPTVLGHAVAIMWRPMLLGVGLLLIVKMVGCFLPNSLQWVMICRMMHSSSDFDDEPGEEHTPKKSLLSRFVKVLWPTISGGVPAEPGATEAPEAPPVHTSSSCRCVMMEDLYMMDAELADKFPIPDDDFELLEVIAARASQKKTWQLSSWALVEEEAGLYLCAKSEGHEEKHRLMTWSGHAVESLQAHLLPQITLDSVEPPTTPTELLHDSDSDDVTVLHPFLVRFTEAELSTRCFVLGCDDEAMSAKWADNLSMYNEIGEQLGDRSENVDILPTPSRWSKKLAHLRAFFGRSSVQRSSHSACAASGGGLKL